MGKKLYVGNLSYDMSSSDLEQLFSQHGTVESAQIIEDRATGRSKGFGFVEMSSDEEAQAAIQALDGQQSSGRTLKVNGVSFKVIGTMKPKGDQGWYNPDDQIFIPLSTAMKRMLGVEHVRSLNIQAATLKSMGALEEAITELMRRRHRLQPWQENDFNIRSQAEFLESTREVSRDRNHVCQ